MKIYIIKVFSDIKLILRPLTSWSQFSLVFHIEYISTLNITIIDRKMKNITNNNMFITKNLGKFSEESRPITYSYGLNICIFSL